MSERTHNVIGLLDRIDHALEVADKKKSFDAGLVIVKEVMALLGLKDVTADLKSFPRLKTNPAWTKNAPDYEDRKASYALSENNDRNIDFKLFWVAKPGKRVISNLIALTPNFEDETFYSNKNVGIDFVLSEHADRLIIVLSNNYKIRVLEIHRRLSNTQKKIFEKWAQEFDFSNKAQFHKIIWDSFDIQPLNKEFYIDISSFFNELIQHLEKKDILDKKHRSQFVNRLIGRIIFCWFLRKKEIIAEDVGYFDTAGKQATDYYAEKLEALFFQVLNTPIEERGFGIDDKTPFLNGGLFEPKESDLCGLHKLSFPADYFERFYSFLNRYNFTTDESTSDFQQVAIDPEMLGRIFENLLAEEIEETGEQARKSKGAFYTPREIVDYMCRESLRAYVSEKLGEDARKGEVLQLLFDKKEHEFDLKGGWGSLGAYKNRIIELLDKIRIIDPACGSGAFPIGMLQIILSIYERLDTRLDHYKTKLGIIKNNIFGVDIEPMAVEISRLRTWLSLIVDENVNPKGENRGVSPLPNLDFKFVCADSLIPLIDEQVGKGLFDTLDENKLLDIRDKYFNARSIARKRELRQKYITLLKEQGNQIFSSDRQRQIETYRPFESDCVATFFDSEFIFGIRSFDVIIANPPYYQLSKDKKVPDAYKSFLKNKYKTSGGRLNTFIFFIHRGVDLLAEDGFLTYIIPNTILTQEYYRDTRRFLLEKTALNRIITYSDMQFDQAVVENVTLFCQKKISKGYGVAIYRQDGASVQFLMNKNVQDYLSEADCNFNVNKDCLNLKIASDQIKTLETYCDINQAIALKGDKSKSLREENKDGKFYKLLDGRNINKYFLRWGGVYLDYKLERIHSCKRQDIFESKEKLLFRRVSANLIFAYDNKQHYCLNTIVVVNLKPGQKIKLKYLLAVLNSKFLNYFYKTKFKSTKTVFSEIQARSVGKLPIKEPTQKEQDAIVDIVDQILAITSSKTYDPKKPNDAITKVSQLQAEVDAMVAKLYGLSPEEVVLINKSFE
jgi:hypothetical protein